MTKEKARAKEPTKEQKELSEEELLEELARLQKGKGIAASKLELCLGPGDYQEARDLQGEIADWSLQTTLVERALEEIRRKQAEERLEEARKEALKLKQECQALLETAWGEIGRASGYLETMWKSFAKIQALSQRYEDRLAELRAKVEANKFDWPEYRAVHEGRDAVSLHSGAAFPLGQGGSEFERWLHSLVFYWTGRGDPVTPPAGQIWRAEGYRLKKDDVLQE